VIDVQLEQNALLTLTKTSTTFEGATVLLLLMV
jgi:hypothetical protein